MSKTNKNKLLIIPRLLAGLPLVFLAVMHFVNPEHMRNILTASGLPMVELSVFAAPAGEVLAGVLLLLGFYARIGGLIGAGTMLPAIYSTVILSNMTVETLPAGLTEVPFVPPLPLPLVVLICALIVAALGGGAWSLGPHNQSKTENGGS